MKLYTIAEAAEALGVSDDTVRRLVDRYKIEAVDLARGAGRRRTIRITQTALDRFLRESVMIKPARRRRSA